MGGLELMLMSRQIDQYSNTRATESSNVFVGSSSSLL